MTIIFLIRSIYCGFWVISENDDDDNESSVTFTE